jgi:alkylhydroperoxidase family enzyme
MNEAKFDALEQYGTSPLFTDAERAALDYVTEVTKDKRINPNTFARMSGHYSERAICEIVWLVASEHFYNMTNIGLNIHSDMPVAERGRLKWAPTTGRPGAGTREWPARRPSFGCD